MTEERNQKMETKVRSEILLQLINSLIEVIEKHIDNAPLTAYLTLRQIKTLLEEDINDKT